jgi:hypothetical protein
MRHHTHKTTNETCRYLVFPKLNECCLCCAADMGCGILSPNWLDGAQYMGIEEKNGHLAYKVRRSSRDGESCVT